MPLALAHLWSLMDYDCCPERGIEMSWSCWLADSAGLSPKLA